MHLTSVKAHPLADALQQAWSHDAAAATLADRQRQSDAEREQAARYTPGPATASVSSLTDRWQRDLGLREREVELATPLWWPGQRQSQQAEAEWAAQERMAQLESRRFQLAGELREAWWALAAARQTSVLAQDRLRLAQALAQSVAARYHAGDLARLDANTAELGQLTAESEASSAKQGVSDAEQRFEQLTGTPAPAELMAEPMPPAVSADTAPPVAPAIIALQATAARARAHLAVLDQARADAPELAVRWTQQRSDASSRPEPALGIKLTIPLGRPTHAAAESAAARAEWSQAEAELAQALRLQALARTQSQQAFDLAKDQIRRAKLAWDLSQDSLQLTERAYALGEADLATLLRARAAAHQAQLHLTLSQITEQATHSRRLQAQGIWP